MKVTLCCDYMQYTPAHTNAISKISKYLHHVWGMIFDVYLFIIFISP
jgi:hypothetical protein